MERSVGIVPIYRADEVVFCLVQHADGHWGFPKGHVDTGERDETAALRELREETGVRGATLVPDKKLIEHYTYERNGQRIEKEVLYFIGIVDERTSTSSEGFAEEIKAVEWLPYKEAKHRITFPESQRILDGACAYLESDLR